MADKRRLDWLDANRANLVSITEKWSEENVLWWQVQKGKKSLSGHPVADIREAIDAAMGWCNACGEARRANIESFFQNHHHLCNFF